MSARSLRLPVFVLTQTCQKEDPGAVARTIPTFAAGESFTYYCRPIEKSVSYGEVAALHAYNLMPVVLDGSGIPWQVANRHILSRLEGDGAPTMSTYIGLADDLADYKRFLEEYQLDFAHFPKAKVLRPTYRYSAVLTQRIRSGEIARNTGKRRMITVTGLYRSMIEDGLLSPAHPPWKEGDAYIKFNDRHGRAVRKKVKTTDVAIKGAKQQDEFDGYINDGGKLRPLTPIEQTWLMDALAELGNPEMTLIFFCSWFTGARLQTVLTLQVRHVRAVVSDHASEVRIPVGPGTGIDTKYDKTGTLFFPRWLYEKLRSYSFGERSVKRRELAGVDSPNQYLFLSNRGVPFYRSRADRHVFDSSSALRHDKDGQTIRQFLTDRVLPLMRKIAGIAIHFRFHDLRASYGMNLSDERLPLVAAGKTTLKQVRKLIQTRLMHSKGETTDLYLNYRENMALGANVQIEYEGHLKALANEAKSISA